MIESFEPPKHHDTLGAVALIGIVVIILSLALMKHCGNEQHVETTNKDSLVDKIKSLEKFIGIREIEYKSQVERAVKAENELKDRKPIYIERVKVIREQAPDTCQPYLIAMQAECDTLQAKSDSTIVELKTTVAKADTLIKAVVSKSETLQHFNDKLTDENKQLDAAKKKAERAKRRAKIGAKIILFTAAAYTGFVMYLTVIK